MLNFDKDWARKELIDFLEWIKTFTEEDKHSIYNSNTEKNMKDWYAVIHDQLNEYGFVNGGPNSWQERPKAMFW